MAVLVRLGKVSCVLAVKVAHGPFRLGETVEV